MIKLLVYDLDGTLIDSREDIANSVNGAFERLGLHPVPTDTIAQFVGSGVEQLISRSLKEVNREFPKSESQKNSLLKKATKLFRKHYQDHLVDQTRLYPGVEQVLEHFKDQRQAVITNKPASFSNEILTHLKVNHFFFRLVGGGDAFPKKPDPASLLDIMNSADVNGTETVLIGDSKIDIDTGRRAGVQTVGVTYGFGTHTEIKEAKPNFILNALVDLIDLKLLQ